VPLWITGYTISEDGSEEGGLDLEDDV